MSDKTTNGVYDDQMTDTLPDAGVHLDPKEYDDDDAIESSGADDSGEVVDVVPGDTEPAGDADKTVATSGPPSEYGEGDLISLGSVAGIPAEEVSAYYRTYGGEKTAERIRELLIGEARKVRSSGGDTKKPQTFAIDLPEFDPDKNPQGIDPALKKALNDQLSALHAYHEAKNKELSDMFSTVQRSLAVNEVRSRESAFEQRIASLGDEYAELLGKGSGYQLDKSSPQFKNRVAVYRHMEALRAAGLGENEDALFRAALGSALSGAMEDVIKRRIKAGLQKRADGAVGTPNKPSGPIKETTKQKEERIKAMLAKELRGDLGY